MPQKLDITKQKAKKKQKRTTKPKSKPKEKKDGDKTKINKPIKSTKPSKPKTSVKKPRVKKGGVITEEQFNTQKNTHMLFEPRRGPRYARDPEDNNKFAKDPISLGHISIDDAILVKGKIYDAKNLQQWFDRGYRTIPHTNLPASQDDIERVKNHYGIKTIDYNNGPIIKMSNNKWYYIYGLYEYILKYAKDNHISLKGNADGKIPYPQKTKDEYKANRFITLEYPPYKNNSHGPSEMYFTDKQLTLIGYVGYWTGRGNYEPLQIFDGNDINPHYNRKPETYV